MGIYLNEMPTTESGFAHFINENIHQSENFWVIRVNRQVYLILNELYLLFGLMFNCLYHFDKELGRGRVGQAIDVQLSPSRKISIPLYSPFHLRIGLTFDVNMLLDSRTIINYNPRTCTDNNYENYS